MNSILNKIIIFISLSILTFAMVNFYPAVLVILIALALSSFLEYFSNYKLNLYAFLGYIIASIFFPQFIYLLPLILYEIAFSKSSAFSFMSIIPIVFHIQIFSSKTIILILIISIFCVVLKYQAINEHNLFNKYLKQHDDFTETSIGLEEKIKELTDKQDVEVNLATLNERNRIAHEIHDNVGHLLSSSIIQIGAIMATSKEEVTKDNLSIVKKTLDSGMNSIRDSIHNLHDDSVDLYAQINALVKNFAFCATNLNYEIDSTLQVKMRYAIIAIVKEALSNVIKHSNATMLTINLIEHPKIIQLIINDNGNFIKKEAENGMGIESIRQRVSAINGIINFDKTNGFKIFISFPKLDKEDK